MYWNGLNNWQKDTIKTCDQYPLALTYKPPGTGKTLTVAAYISCRLNRSPKDKIMVYLPRNGVVLVLVRSTIATIGKDDIVNLQCNGGLFPFVHIRSEGVIHARYLCGQLPLGDYHLRTFVSEWQ